MGLLDIFSKKDKTKKELLYYALVMKKAILQYNLQKTGIVPEHPNISKEEVLEQNVANLTDLLFDIIGDDFDLEEAAQSQFDDSELKEKWQEKVKFLDEQIENSEAKKAAKEPDTPPSIYS